MKTDTLTTILKMGNISISRFLLSNYKKLGITSEEFIFLAYLMNEGDSLDLDSEKIGKAIGINASEILNIIYSLKEKNLIDMLVNKKDKKVISEFLTLEPFYNKLSMFTIEYLNDTKENNDNSHIYELFEREFGRTLSPMEYEIINAWLDNNTNVELIKEALKEATFNGVSNLRYIDKILYEWGKKGFKNTSDIKKKREVASKDKKVELFDYNWLEDDE